MTTEHGITWRNNIHGTLRSTHGLKCEITVNCGDSKTLKGKDISMLISDNFQLKSLTQDQTQDQI